MSADRVEQLFSVLCRGEAEQNQIAKTVRRQTCFPPVREQVANRKETFETTLGKHRILKFKITQIPGYLRSK